VEGALDAELTSHWGSAPHVCHGSPEGNTHHGTGQKRVQTATGRLDLVVPRDRQGSVDPQLVKKRQRRLEGVDDKGLSLNACGLSTREMPLISKRGTAKLHTYLDNLPVHIHIHGNPWRPYRTSSMRSELLASPL
jgi:transposase-like protein